MKLIPSLRMLIHGSDVEQAKAEERRLIESFDAQGRESEAKLLAAYTDGCEYATVGKYIPTGQPIRLTKARLRGHWSIVGPSGAGKSYFLCLVVKALLASGVRRFFVADPKNELLELIECALVDFARSLPSSQADDLLSRVVKLDPFSKTALPALHILAPEPGLDTELQAYEIATLITSEINLGGLGIRQEGLLHRAIESLIRAELPLTALPMVLGNPLIFEQLAEGNPASELLLATAERLRDEPRERVQGLVARAEALLRLKATRLSLGAPRSLDFAKLLDERIVLINLAPPQGSDDIARFLRGLIWTRLAHAIRARANNSTPTFVAIDEFPTFLNAGGSRLSDGVEDLLRLARSKGVFLMLLAQDMVSVGKTSATLPQVMRNNCHIHAFFRTRDDWSFALPITGRRPRAQALPWEEKRGGYLDRGAERELLREELSRLPDRQLYLWDQRLGGPAILMKTADLSLRASAEELRALTARASANDCVLPIGELERYEAATQARLLALKGKQNTRLPAAEPLRRSGKRPLDIG